MKAVRRNLWIVFVSVFLAATSQAAHSEGQSEKEKGAADKTPPEQKQRYEEFENLLSGAKLVGHFTVLGREPDSMPQEEYTIDSVEKLPTGNRWLFNARVQYADQDLTLSLPLQVEWAGDTPMITLTDLKIPALGTFSARVLFYNDKYAGTWTHGEAGGHMFGTIEKLAEEEENGDDGQ